MTLFRTAMQRRAGLRRGGSSFAARGPKTPTPLTLRFPLTAAFSSSSANTPSIYDGWSGLSAFGSRVVDRLPELERYEREGVFPPAMTRLGRTLLFARLQLPTATEIDAVEFLGGAQHAIDLALHTMFSQEIANFAFGESTESPAAQTLARIVSPMCYDLFFQGLKGMRGTMRTMEMRSLDIRAVHLAGATWERLTLADAKLQERQDLATTHDLIRARMLVSELNASAAASASPSSTELTGLTDPESIVIEDADHETTVERLRLDVIAETTECVATSTVDEPEQTVTRDTAALWRFESLVTRPEDIDWRVLTFMEKPPGITQW